MGQQQSGLAEDLDEIVSKKGEYIKLAAEKIAEADFLLLATGAGFSADSGLAVFKDIADVPVYHQMGLTYYDLCQPKWIELDPEIFYGFWGMCFNDYRTTNPHEGYSIVKKWRDTIFAKEQTLMKPITNRVHNYLQDTVSKEVVDHWKRFCETPLDNFELLARDNKRQKIDPASGEIQDVIDLSQEENETPRNIKSFYVYTSNIDSHSQKAGLDDNETYEIHGTLEQWHCSKKCTEEVWSAPSDFSFEVDKQTMRCKAQEKSSTESKGWQSNHPTCINCGAPARPTVLMFCDTSYVGNLNKNANYYQWKQSVLTFLRTNPNKKMVIIEAGCGVRVATVRRQTQQWLDECPRGQCTVIRINPDYPGSSVNGLIRIVGKCRDVLKLIDEQIQALQL